MEDVEKKLLEDLISIKQKIIDTQKEIIENDNKIIDNLKQQISMYKESFNKIRKGLGIPDEVEGKEEVG